MLTTDRDRVLLERLNCHPRLRARMESLLAVVENAAGDCAKADAAERWVLDELRQMGNEALTAWADGGWRWRWPTRSRTGGRAEKNSTGTPPLVRSR